MMIRKLTSALCLFAGISTSLFAQNSRFAADGVIEFEKSINVYAILQKRVTDENSSFFTPMIEQYKKAQPQFKLLKSNLYFSKNKTLYKPIEDENATSNDNFLSSDPAFKQINTTYIDVDTHQQVTQKKVFEETFLVKDSTRAIKWKITSETREIAGYNCRRANALIMDSIYVVAFYTDQIPVSGGPESFSGLPGMILGVALPHENITWFAKKVTDKPIESSVIMPPAKGKPATNKSLPIILNSTFKQWGEEGKSYLKTFAL